MSLNDQFIQAFADGVLETIKILCKVDAKWVIERVDHSPVKNRAVMATIPLVSSTLNGRVVLSLEQSTFLTLMGRMRGKIYTEFENEISDGVAELLNIVFGVAKRSLNASGYDIATALPELIGETERLKSPNHVQNEQDKHSNHHVVLIFTTDFGSIYLNLVIHK